MQGKPATVSVARCAELIFAIVSLLLWLTMPFPPTWLVWRTWFILTVSVILGFVLFWQLRTNTGKAWLRAGLFSALVIFQFVAAPPRDRHIEWTDPGVALSMIMVYGWALAQGIVLICSILWWRSSQQTQPSIGA